MRHLHEKISKGEIEIEAEIEAEIEIEIEIEAHTEGEGTALGSRLRLPSGLSHRSCACALIYVV